ncbi:hypothetical protein ACIA98_40010 [Streptomyces sp. NPDC051366]|uniref:hypothetical protein n=1 Tax=Streptomyces sp. NPDC051366 TaxID=3365652 RepID=UPI0037A8096D
MNTDFNKTLPMGDESTHIGEGTGIGERNHPKRGTDSGVRIKHPGKHIWVCVAAPCGPPENALIGG